MTLLDEEHGQKVPHTLPREFQRRTEDRRVEKCFSTRLLSKGRSERDAPIGVLVDRKISSEKVVGGRVFRRRLWLSRGFVTTVARPEYDMVVGWVAEIDHTAKP